MTVAEVGEAYCRHVKALGRKTATVNSYASLLRVHVAPIIGTVAVDKLSRRDLERFMAVMADRGSSSKTIRLALSIVHGVDEFALGQEWATAPNPVKRVPRPQVPAYDEIRFLRPEEVEALLRAFDDGALAQTDRALIMTAAMTGLRQGELLALRWRDVDWRAGRIARPPHVLAWRVRGAEVAAGHPLRPDGGQARGGA